MENKSIMIYFPLILLGGTEMAILNLIKNLHGFKITIAYNSDNSSKKILNMMSKYAEVIKIDNSSRKKYKTDVLISCYYYDDANSPLKHIKRKKTFYWFHTIGDYFNKSKLKFNRNDEIIFVSNSSKMKMVSLNPKNKKITKAHVINNMLDTEKIIKKSTEEVEFDFNNDLNLVTVGRMTPAKGFNRMAHLAKKIKDCGIDFKWYIIGGVYTLAPNALEIEQNIKALFSDFKDEIVFLGPKINPFKYMKKCDYLVLLSDEETWGMVVTEAKTLNVPCIVTDFKVAYEQIKDNHNGIILSLNDLSSYKKRINDIVDPVNRERFKENLKDFKYHNNIIIKKWFKILEDDYEIYDYYS